MIDDLFIGLCIIVLLAITVEIMVYKLNELQDFKPGGFSSPDKHNKTLEVFNVLAKTGIAVLLFKSWVRDIFDGYMLSGSKGAENTNPVIDNMESRVPNSEVRAPSTRGNAPISIKDNRPIEIHHDGQNPMGPFEEMHPSDHRYGSNYVTNHPNYDQPSLIDRAQFRSWVREYWENEWDNGRW